ncbi:MAG: hypothetical protein GY910_22500 [bacterium]|nr:hypothetical protein [bacterium]
MTTEPARSGDDLSRAFAALVSTLRTVETDIRKSPSFGDEAEQVGAYRHILRAVAKGLEAETLQDPDYPYFRILDWWLREGGDNPDQRYAFTPIRGGETYRLWGELGSATRVEFQIYAGRPWDGSGRSAGYLAFEEIEIEDDGSFEIWLSAEAREGNWLSNPVEGTTLFARHIYGDWNEGRTGDIHIDRVGYEGKRRPPESAAELADRIRAAAAMFGTTARTWPEFVRRRYVDTGDTNTLPAPYDTYALGGAKGRWMSGGSFALADEEALLLRIPQTRAQYQAVQLTDMWFASLEHGNQVSSLTATQSILAPDGSYYYVISREDPGYSNWLDAGALRRGIFLLRWDGVLGELAEDQFPSAKLVTVGELAAAIPGFSTVDEEERERVRHQRRRHLQLRSHR